MQLHRNDLTVLAAALLAPGLLAQDAPGDRPPPTPESRLAATGVAEAHPGLDGHERFVQEQDAEAARDAGRAAEARDARLSALLDAWRLPATLPTDTPAPIRRPPTPAPFVRRGDAGRAEIALCWAAPPN